MPATENVALVLALVGAVNVVVPGPLTCDHTTVSVLPAGSPSSPAVPASVAAFGSVTLWSAPAFAVGAALVGGGVSVTVTATVSLALSVPSLAVSCST